MKNIYFPEENITINDLYYICYMIEKISRHLHQRNKYVVNKIGSKNLYHLISCANVLHCENPLKVMNDWIEQYELVQGDFVITDVDSDLVSTIPDPLDIGEVYQRLIVDTAPPEEDYVEGIIRVYNDSLCETIDNYNASAYYEPSYIIARAYYNGGF